MTILDYTIVVVYLIAMVMVGMMMQKRASAGIDSYFLGNRGMPWWALGASGMASNLDVAGTMINTAWIFALGAAGMFIEIRGGVTLIMAFLMIFMGKWNRRARVMTMAEWMHFRFGKEREGDVARLISAISIIVLIIAMITYFAVGAGKFVSTFLGIPDIGRVTRTLEATDMRNLDDAFLDLEDKTVVIQETVKDEDSRIPELAAMRNAVTEMLKAWIDLKEERTRISAMAAFETEMTETGKIIRSLRSAVERSLLAASERETALIEIDGLIERLSTIDRVYEDATDYTIILEGRFLAALLMICLAMIYTVASGLYGVVWTDVFQGLLIFGTIVFVCVTAFTKFQIPELFSISVPMRDGTFQAIQTTREAWTGIVPRWRLAFPSDSAYSIYNLFGIAIIFYLIKVTIEGSGGTSGYMIQRYFAARSDRDAGLLSLFWTFLLSFRWPFIAAIAIMGVAFGARQGVISDPETVLPVVVNELIPTGIKGLLVAGLMAAAMSTFDSTVNAGAAYWVKDIYQAYINPKADGRTLMRHSRWASIIIVLLGLLFSLAIQNINEIWGWITMSIGAGMIIPTLVRWYWWRMNGYGFAIGTAAGMAAAIIQRLVFPDVPEYVSFSFASGISFIAMLIGTYATKPTNMDVLFDFYKTTRPFGFWGPIRSRIPIGQLAKVDVENRRDKISILMAVPWQIVLFLMWITVMMKRWDLFGILLGLLAILSLGLYFTWFRHLSTEVTLESGE